MNSKSKEALWKQILDRLTLTQEDQTLFEGEDLLPVTVTTARPLTTEEAGLLQELLTEKFHKPVELQEQKVDSKVVGGVLIQYGDHIFDATMKRQLEKMDAIMKAIHLNDQDLDQTEKMTDALAQGVKSFHNDVDLEEIGVVEKVGDGICTASGLGGAMSGELVALHDGVYGMVQNLRENEVGIVLLGGATEIKEGDMVRRTGEIMEIPVGDAMLGRIVNPLGLPLDGKGAIKTQVKYPIEHQAPGIAARQPVDVPLQTGLKAVDALVPIGRGQRELIIGDRGTGKTAIAIDTILNQKGKDVICIYVAIGQKASSVARLYHTFEQYGASAYTMIVAATAADTAPMQYLAPYAGAAVGEYFMDQGKDVLIVYDDLSKHAVAYRAMSLLLRRPPGREAYPGDVFYLHSRLLERACRRNERHGGGSMTALPIIETQAGDVSGYIPTNVISITDGQIYLETDLFNSGIRPALNSGLSVSRVGGAAQTKAMKTVAGTLRLSLAQYRELAAFAQFGSDLDRETKAQLDRGARVTEMLKQGQYQPLSMAQEVVSLYAVNNGFLDEVPVEDVTRYEHEMLGYLNNHCSIILTRLEKEQKLTDDLKEELDEALDDFGKMFAPGTAGGM
ncbi:F0F1 ATP synthase subunit alpha [Acidaminococcus massiliensis]|jgi:F-type H+-transporting ATPase subunit alpha|uniref:F0F1 ATP synthase subunit alpha n=1 Tax=Acidaminococcus massiliensis TaxID=1852375 RepID=UPI00094E803F|nr:F0F1 ATP synthase subunit alpha [Acidaminococcus massiliensis]